MKKYYIIIIYILLFFSINVSAQLNLGMNSIAGKPAGTTILRDYESIGVNPSNLAWENNKRVSLGLLYLNIDLESKALNKKEILDIIKNFGNDFTDSDKSKYASLFNTKNGLNLSSNICWLNLSVNMNRIGGLAFNLRDRIVTHFSANKYFADILFNGSSSSYLKDSSLYKQPISIVFNGTDVHFEHLRELNVAYGVKITDLPGDIKIYGGIGYRYIWGLSYLNIKADNENLTAQSSLNGSDVYVSDSVIKSIKLSNAYLSAKSIFNSPGNGSAIDIGVSAIILNKLKFGASIVNLGSISWNKETYEGKNINMKKLDSTLTGLNSFNVIDQIGYIFNQDGLMEFKKVSSFKTNLPAEMRVGAGIRFSKLLSVGADVVTQLSDVYSNKGESIYSAGAEFNLFNVIKLNSGVSGNIDMGWNIPLGITLSTAGFYEIYLATNDVLTYFDRTRNPLLSFAVCAIRINISKKEK